MFSGKHKGKLNNDKNPQLFIIPKNHRDNHFSSIQYSHV
jgi:hypothetical protein